MCLTSQINKLESDLSKQEQYIKYLYSIIEGYEEEIEDLHKKNSELRVQLKDPHSKKNVLCHWNEK